jgi:hypothetical protein
LALVDKQFFDKNPRLETVVGFLLGSATASYKARTAHEQDN